MVKWFVFAKDIVKGPYETQEIKSQHRSGEIKGTSLVWGRLVPDWMNASEWVDQVDGLISKMDIYSDDDRAWHYSYESETYGPYKRVELIEELVNVKIHDRVHLWTTGMEDWSPLFEFHDILDDIGINQRAHKRAHIEGTVLVTKSTGEVTAGKLSTISQEGLGFYGMINLFPGEAVTIEIISTHFKTHLRLSATIKYVSEKYFIGVRFESPSSEVQSQIIDYVRNFDESTQTYAQAA